MPPALTARTFRVAVRTFEGVPKVDIGRALSVSEFNAIALRYCPAR